MKIKQEETRNILKKALDFPEYFVYNKAIRNEKQMKETSQRKIRKKEVRSIGIVSLEPIFNLQKSGVYIERQIFTGIKRQPTCFE